MKKIFLLSIASFAILFSAVGQKIDKFSEDSSEFIAQLEEMMTASKNKKREEIFTEFQQTFLGDAFTPEEQVKTIQVANGMLANKLKAFPHFTDYIISLIAIKKKGNATTLLAEWQMVLSKIILDIPSQKRKPIKAYLKFSKDLFLHNALRKGSGSGTSWYALSDDFHLDYEEATAVVKYEKTDLLSSRLKDSIIIHETAGRFYPIKDLWKGKGGIVNWERYDLKDTYAELLDYEFFINKGIYRVAKVKMHYPLYFGQQSIEGSFSDKLGKYSAEKGGGYPRFESTNHQLKIKEVGERVDYTGGFKLHGTTVYGIGDKLNKCGIVISDKYGKVVYQGKGEQFLIHQGEKITGQQVESTIYYGNDSIYHPSVNMRYLISQEKIQLSRGEQGSDRNPFYDSHRDFNINTENIDIFVQQDSLVIGKPSVKMARKGPVEFESLQFFSKGEYYRIQSIASSNPLAIMKATATQEGNNFINSSVLAQRINSRFTIKNIERLLYELVAKGFINYYPDDHLVEVKPKVFHYVDADAGDIDYDYYKIVSDTKGTNASMKMGQLDMVVNGVERVIMSKKQRVALKPLQNQILLKEFRNFDTDGKIFAGLTTIEGKDFHYDYKNYQFKLDSVRFFDLYIPTGGLDKNKQAIAFSIGSRIEHIQGNLLIDARDNKSGKEDIDMFPSLQSKGNSYVYYHRDSTQHFAYKRDSFYFKLNPFSFNNLGKYTGLDVEFKGKLISADIFPNIKETIRLREDHSLGFITETDRNGLPLYTGKGKYEGNIDLSNAGLLGEGNIKYLGASVDSEDIIFKPKQLLASAKEFTLQEARGKDPEIPNVLGIDVKIDWKPYRDSMYIKSAEAPFKMFNEDNHTLKGTLILTPGGLKGDGTLDWDKATMRSELFAFGAYSSKADTTNLSIKAFDADDLALKTKNVKSEVDFDEQMGKFEANDDHAITELPYNKYITTMNEFTWDMEKGMVEFKSDPEKPAVFTSTHPDQDSLRFVGKNAKFNINSNELSIDEVPYVVTADAFVYPDSGFVKIEKGGRMGILENAKIVVDTLTKYHVINRATVEISGKRFYKASGFYEYNIPGKEQEIELQNIVGQGIGKSHGRYNKKRVATRATGKISAEQDFYIDKKTAFQGTISLNGESKTLKFDGFAKLKAEKLPIKPWFTISCEGDKKNLIIKFDKPKSLDGQPLRTGLFLSKETARIYPKVMRPLHYRKDRGIFPVTGVFRYDKKKDEFIFGDSSKVVRNEMMGNVFTFKNRDGSVHAEGKFNLGSELKHIKIDAAGIGKTKFPPPPPEVDENMMSAEEDAEAVVGPAPEFPVTLETMVGIQLIIPDKLMKPMLKDFETESFNTSVIAYLTDINFYKKAAFELFGNTKDTKEAIDGITSGYLDLPAKVNPYTFLFSKLNLKWDPDYQSFVTTEKKSGLATINGKNINKKLETYVEIKMPSNNDDRLYIYIKSPSQLYYFFGFKQGILNVVSNNTAFTDALRDLKGKEKIYKMKGGETYEIQEVEPGTAQRFLRRIKAAGK